MVDPRRPQAEADGMVFGFLGVKISGGGVWTSGEGATSANSVEKPYSAVRN
jgi:hypothetical protein